MDATVEHSLHFALLKAQSLLAKQLFLRLDGSGLTSGQPKLLEYLAGHDGCIQRELAAACEVESATITSLLNRMENRGLIRRTPQPGDRRATQVSLTPTGRAAAEQVHRLFAELENRAFAGFSEAERNQFLAMLGRIVQNQTIPPNRGPAV